MSTSLDDAIAREERLIAAYEAELQDLCDKEKKKEETSDDQEASSFESILLKDTTLLLDEPVNEQTLSIHSLIRGFRFTSVDSISALSYRLKGYFLDDPTVQANIRLHLEPSRTKVSLFEFGLSEGHEWIQQEARHYESSLPMWIQAVANYLSFEKKRKEILQGWSGQYGVVSTRDRSKVVLELPLCTKKEKDYREPILSLIWFWSWGKGRDVLRLPTQSGSPLDQHGLNQLVKVSGSCRQALELILPKDDSVQVPVDQDADDEEESTTSEEDRSDDEETPPSSPNRHSLSEYEKLRLQRIKRNQAVLRELGLAPTSESTASSSRKRGRPYLSSWQRGRKKGR